MQITRFLAVAFSSLVLATAAYSATYQHVQGQVELEAVPEKILVFDMAAADTLGALGVEISGLTKVHALGSLEKYQANNYIDTGSFWEPDFETTAASQADLIIVGGRTGRQYDAMKKIAPTIDITVWGEGFLDQFYRTTGLLAEITGKENEAARYLGAIQSQVVAINEKAEDAGNALFILISGGKISAYGPSSRFGWLHNELGITPAIENVKEATHGEPVSFEFLKEVNPDMLFVLDRDAAIGRDSGSAEALLDNDLVKSLNAYQNDRIVYLDGVSWYMISYGIDAIQTSLSEIEAAL